MKSQWLLSVSLFLLSVFLVSSVICSQETFSFADLDKDETRLQAADYFINKNFFFTRIYPPRIESKEHLKEINADYKAVIRSLKSKLSDDPKNIEIIWRLAFVYTQTYNLDWPESKDNLEKLYKLLFELDPEHALGNFHYGAHLSGTGVPQDTKKSVYHLKKAKSHGFDHALTMIGIAYMQMGETKKALKYFKKFQEIYPDDPQTMMLIQGIEKGDGTIIESMTIDKDGNRTSKIIKLDSQKE